MFNWFAPDAAQISAQADNYIAAFGDAAYCCAQSEERRAFSAGDKAGGKVFSRIRMEIARKLDYKPNLDIPERDVAKLLAYSSDDSLASSRRMLMMRIATETWDNEGGAGASMRH